MPIFIPGFYLHGLTKWGALCKVLLPKKWEELFITTEERQQKTPFTAVAMPRLHTPSEED